MSEMEDRVTELELRFMEQQSMLQSLSDVVYAQSRALDAVQAEVEVLRKKLQAEPGLVDASEKERPPHY